MGETYDARCELRLELARLRRLHLGPVDVGAEMQPAIGPSRRTCAFAEYKTKVEPRPGVYVLDLAQLAGVARLTVNGQAGQKIRLRFAERLNPDGTIYTINLRSARATDTYVCRGGETEVCQPRFTFHGFQYVEITGLTEAPKPDTVVGVALSSDTPVVGSFQCTDAMFNQLYSNIVCTQRSNFIDLPTDCPQRVERLGWTGDAQVYVRTATLNTDVQEFFTVAGGPGGRTAQDGQFPMVAPVKVASDDNDPAWATRASSAPGPSTKSATVASWRGTTPA